MKSIFTIIFLCLNVIIYAQPTDYLVRYLFDGDATEETGNGNTMTSVDDLPTLTTDRFGSTNSAYDFNGTSEYLNDYNLENWPERDVTVSVWFNADDLSSNGTLIDLRGSFNSNISVNSTSIAVVRFTGFESYNFNTHEWYHVAFTVSSSGALVLYVNGEQIATGQNNEAQNWGYLSVGANFFSSWGNFFDGKIDDLAIFGRELSASEVAEIYSSEFHQITSISTFHASVGESLTIQGTNFEETTSENTILFGSIPATISSGSTTELVVTVPDGAENGPISVLRKGYVAQSSEYFVLNYQAPTFSQTTFKDKEDFTTGSTPLETVLGDIDGDGKLDIVVTNSGSNTVSVLRNTSSGKDITSASFATKVDFGTNSSPHGVALDDLDGDGKVDLIVANRGSSNVSVFRNTSTSGSIAFDSKVDFTVGSEPFSLAIGDLNSDAKKDIIAVNRIGESISILENISVPGSISSSSFKTNVDFSTGGDPRGVVIADFDGDGYPDVAAQNYNDHTVSVFRNSDQTGSITSSFLSAKVDFGIGLSPRAIEAADFNQDGKIDIVATSPGNISISVLENNSTSGAINSGSFATNQQFTTGSNPYQIALGDMNADGVLDVLVTNESSNSFSVLLNSNNGNISFESKVDFNTATSPVGIYTGDLDLDGTPEVVVANSQSTSVSVFKYIENSTNLIASYAFSGDATDQSGNGIDGTVSGATLAPDRFDNFNAAYSFDGVNGHNITGSDASFPTGSSARTISGWLRKSTTDDQGHILQYGSEGSAGEKFGLGLNNGHPFFWGSNADLEGTTDIIDDNWHHLAVTYDGTDVILYLDGAQETTASLALNTVLSGVFHIGSGGLDDYDGFIDDVRLYSRALSSSEISDIYSEHNWPINTVGITGTALTGGTNTDEIFLDNVALGSAQNYTWAKVDYLYNGNIKFRTNSSNTTNWGDDEPDGIGDQDGADIAVTEGLYVIKINVSTGEYSLTSLSSIGIIGTARGGSDWSDPDDDLSDVSSDYDNGFFSLENFTMVTGEWKLRANDDWNLINWGGLDGTFDHFGANINLTDGGSYNLVADIISNRYTLGFYDPIAQYDMDGNGIDATGNGITGTLQGDTQNGTDRFGFDGNALQFDGDGDYITITNSSLAIGKDESFALNTWVQPSQATSMVIYQSRDADLSTPRISIFLDDELRLNSIFSDGTTTSQFESPVTLKANTWSMVSVVYDRIIDVMRVYVDGKYQGFIITPDFDYNFDTQHIGASVNGSFSFNGQMDDFRLFNRALSANEITSIYNDQTGLLAYFPFNGDSNDESGNGNNATLGDGSTSSLFPALATDRLNGGSGAYSFDGSDDYMEIPTTYLSGSNAASVAFWVNTTSNSTFQDLVSLGNVRTYISSDGNVYGQLFTGSVGYTTASPIEANQWNHYVVTYDGATFIIYKNGVHSNETSISGGIDNATGSSYIGSLTGTGSYLSGAIDEIRVYNRTLSLNEIQKIYTSESGIFTHLTFDNSQTFDESGNGKPGTITGAVVSEDRYDETNNALIFDGDDYVIIDSQEAPIDVFTTMAWVKYSGDGGNIIGFGDNNVTPSQWDRYLDVDTDGLVTFYVFPGSAESITSTTLLNGDQWYHIAATLSSDGMKLFINGIEEASNNSVTSGENLNGYWRLGQNLTGSIDDSRIYYRALDVTEIYNIFVQESSGETDILTFDAGQTNAATISTGSHTIDLTLDHGMDLHKVVGTFTASAGASVLLSGSVLNSGTSEINANDAQILVVRALDGTEQNWTLTVTQDHPTSIQYQKLSNVPILSLAEGVASGFMWGDVNGDNYPDVMMTEYGNPGTTQLFFNDQSLNFTDQSSQLDSDGDANFVDYDNDGDLDILTIDESTTVRIIFENDGAGNFTRISGLFGSPGTYQFNTAVGDYDNDGDLDLYMLNQNNNSGLNTLFQSNGDGTFTEITTGDHVAEGESSLDASFIDYDYDGDADLFVSNNNAENNSAYLNNSDGTFTQATGGLFISEALGTEGQSWMDYNDDGYIDLYETVVDGDDNFYQNNGDGTFTDISSTLGDGNTNSAAAAWGDYDNDGDPDLFIATGGDNLNRLFSNDGDGTFTEITSTLINEVSDASSGNFVDFNLDGGLDISVTNWSYDNYLYYNSGNSNNYFGVRLTGVESNKSAVGARLRMVSKVDGTNDLIQYRTVIHTHGRRAQSGYAQHFGVGAATAIDSLEIWWPSGTYQLILNANVNDYLDVTEQSSTAEITDFVVTDQVSSVIDNSTKTVTVVVPFGTDLTAVSPTVSISTDASVSPNSGVSQDFTSAVTYTVTAEDGSTKDYSVTVDDEFNTANDILTFDITNQSGTTVIDATNHTVELTMPNGTDVTALSPTISLSENATASPLSGVSSDFTAAVTYTITAEDGMAQDWTVSINVLPVVSDGLIAYYPFDGNANDRSGNRYDGSIDGQVLSEDRNGTAGAAYLFNGTDGEIQVTSFTSSILTADFSYLAWVKVVSYPSSLNAVLFTPNVYFEINNSGDVVFNANDGEIGWSSDSSPIDIEKWHLVATTYESGLTKLFVDGQEVSSNTAEINHGSNAGYLSIGGNPGASNGDADAGQWFDGTIDDIRVYNRALSPLEIAQIYNTEAQTGLVAFYPFNGNDNDESGNNFNPTSNSATLGLDRYNNATSAYSFDGVDDNILASDIPKVSNFTVSGWLQTEVNDTYQIIADLEGFFGLATKDDSLIAVLRTNVDGFYEVVKHQSFPSDGRWHHFVATYNGSTFGLYMDGDSIAGAAVSSIYHELDPMNLRIGSNANAAWWNGSLDEIRLHNKSLSTAEILVLYNEEKPPFSTENDILTFSFSEQSGDATIDATNHTIEIYVVNGSGLSSLAPTITVSDNASVSPGSGVSADFSSDATYTVTAEDGTTQDWTVSVVELPVVSDGLVIYYPFDGNADDKSGNNFNGIPAGRNDGPPALTSDRFGESNKSYLFDGFDDHIKASNFNFNNEVGTAFTYSLWIYFEEYNSADDYPLIISKATLSITPSGNLRFSSPSGLVESSDAIALNKWHMITTTFQNDLVTYYLDGIEDVSFSVTVPDVGDANFFIGGDEFGDPGIAFNFYKGQVDDVRLYNRVLTSSEISQIYNSEAETGLVAYYPFNGNANDESGNSHNGTVSGAVLANDRYGNANSAYSFDGVDDIINLSSPVLMTNQTYTSNIWLNSNSEALNTILYDDQGGNSVLWDNHTIGLSYSNSENSEFGSVNSQEIKVADNQWTMITITKEANLIKMYFDGIKVKEETISLINTSTQSYEAIGGNFHSVDRFFGGIIDDIRIYDDVKTDDEILAIFNLEKPPFSSENDILTFSFTEQTGAATINATNHTVEIEVARNTDLTTLIPTITVSDNAGISPASGGAQDFSDGETYTVTAEDGTVQNWVVTVREAVVGAEGLVAYYPWDGDANDLSGNNYHGILEGTEDVPTFGDDQYGNANKAIEFYNNDASVRIPHNAEWDFNEAWTFSTWVNPKTLPGLDAQHWDVILEIGHHGQIIIQADGSFVYHWNDGVITDTYTAVTEPIINIGEWSMVTITVDEDDLLKMFYNTVQLSLNEGITGAIGSSLTISRESGVRDNFSRFSDGVLSTSDDPRSLNAFLNNSRIYNKALTDFEIQEIYNAEKVSALPTDISLSSSEISENQPAGTFIGTFSTSDQDDDIGHTYSLVSGSDNFSISNDTLFSAATFEFDGETAITSYLINVRTADPAGGEFEKEFTITIIDEDEENNDAPTDILLSSNTVPEGDDDWLVGNLSTVDPDSEEFTYTLTEGATTEFKLVNGNQLFTNVAFDFESQPNYSLTVESSDGELSIAKTFTIEVLDVGPVFSNPPSITEYELGGDGVDVSIDVSSDDPIEKVDVVYRKLSSSTELRSTLTADGSTYTHAFSDGDFDASGIQFKFEATVTTDNGSLTESSDFFSIGTITDVNVSVPVSSEGGTAQNLYRILAFPHDEPNTTAYFGGQGTAITDYRLFTWNTSSSRYDEYPTNFSNVGPGIGYFFISKDPPNLKAGGKSVRVSNGVFILSQTLRAGWNQIGNPFLGNIDWTAVVDHNISSSKITEGEAGELIRYVDDWLPDQNAMSQYEGAFFRLAEGTDPISGFEIPISAITGTGRMAHDVTVPGVVNIDRNDWKIDFHINAGDINYHIAGFGINPEAKEGLDLLDRYQVPRLNQFMEVHFEQGQRRNVKPSSEVVKWSFTLPHNIDDEKFVMNWDKPVSSLNTIMLLDKTLNKIYDLKISAPLTLNSSSVGQFELYYGRENEILNHIDLQGIYLTSLYPNPGENDLTLNVLSDGPREINITVIDLLGKTVLSQGMTVSKGGNNIYLDLKANGIASGIYQLVVEGQGVTPIISKFIKQ